MNRITTKTSTPNWETLYGIASTQEGYFTTAQAAQAGYYPQLLTKYLKNGRIHRIRRGIYRLVHFPMGENEDLVVLWLWTDRIGIFSHETALVMHGLSDVMPTKIHITLPSGWQSRRLRVPMDVVLHFADIPNTDQTWHETVPITTVERTLVDCANDNVAPVHILDAFEEAAGRGLIDRRALPSVVSYLKQFFAVSRSKSGPRFRSTSSRRSSSLK